MASRPSRSTSSAIARGRALAGLGVARLVELVSDGDTRVTLNVLLDVINEGIDVLYLVCHGRMDTETAWVYLQDPDGTVATCTADELVARYANSSGAR